MIKHCIVCNLKPVFGKIFDYIILQPTAQLKTNAHLYLLAILEFLKPEMIIRVNKTNV